MSNSKKNEQEMCNDPERRKIIHCVSEFLEQLPASTDLESITMRQIKDYLSLQFSEDEWELVLKEQKEFLKVQAQQQIADFVANQQAHKSQKRRKQARNDLSEAYHDRVKIKKSGDGGNALKGDRVKVPDVPEACQICTRSGDDDKSLLVICLIHVILTCKLLFKRMKRLQ